jgi:FtsP/CotA-like multicopper oxidase with cupredoxin domain
MPTRRAVVLSALAAAALRPNAATAEGAGETAPVELRLVKRTIDVNGKSAAAYAIRQSKGVEGLTTTVGDRFRVRVVNDIGAPSLIHWHGLSPPWRQDGVPEVSGPAIPAGGGAEYDFPLAYGGTFWMHSHEGLQEQLLLDAPLIIRDERDKPDRQEIVVKLNDFSFTPPEEIFENLRKPRQAMSMGSGGMAGMSEHDAASGPDLNDVTYDAFLANDRTLADPEVVKVEPGGEALLRVINASAMSSYHFDLGKLKGSLIAVDGTLIEPIVASQFPINVAQRLDIVLTFPKAAGAYPILAAVEGERNRSGVVLLAGDAAVSRLPPTASNPAPPITMDLERRLRALTPLQPRKPDRVLNVDLTGDMSKYIWSLNGVVWNPQVPPLQVAKGERVAIVMRNTTGMPHPMHLHGHRFQVGAINGEKFAGAVRDTVRVPARGQVTVMFDADNPGVWAFHCHMLYHMAAGMFATVAYV